MKGRIRVDDSPITVLSLCTGGAISCADSCAHPDRTVWQKPGFSAGTSVLNDMSARYAEYGGRHDDPVRYVIDKSRRMYEDGNAYYGKRCALIALMSNALFAEVFEAEESNGGPRFNPDKEMK